MTVTFTVTSRSTSSRQCACAFCRPHEGFFFFGKASQQPGPSAPPTVAPSDFWLFPKLKSSLKVRRFVNATVTCRDHIILDFITRTVFGEQYRSLGSSLCSFLHSPDASSLFWPKHSPQHPFLRQPQPTFLPQCEQPSFTPMQNNRQNYSFVYLSLYVFG